MGRGAALFIGTYDHSLDPKGRVILPRKFRDELGQDMVITKGVGKDAACTCSPRPSSRPSRPSSTASP